MVCICNCVRSDSNNGRHAQEAERRVLISSNLVSTTCSLPKATNHNLVIPICNYHLRAPNNQVMCCKVTLHFLQYADSFAHLSKPMPLSRSGNFWALILIILELGEHHLSRWGSTTFPGGGAPPIQVPPDFMLGITSEENFIQTSTPGLYSEEIVMKLGPCLASITVKNPFTTLSGKTCKSFKPRPCFAGEQIRLRETI